MIPGFSPILGGLPNTRLKPTCLCLAVQLMSPWRAA